MEIKLLDQIFDQDPIREDSIDVPDCFGEYDKKNKLCLGHCAIAIKCCVTQAQHPKTDLLEKLLSYNDYSVKPN
ncbi:MAG: hypothetical protein HUN04_03725 [Desulfobacter sp.]|nr:MAG: hypothetical protein HUN04_03725 [Desulfobacter sp.]